MTDISNNLRIRATQVPYLNLGGFDFQKLAEDIINAANEIEQQAKRIKELEAENKKLIEGQKAKIEAGS